MPGLTQFLPLAVGAEFALFAMVYLFRRHIGTFYSWTQATYVKSTATGALIVGGFIAIVFLACVTFAMMKPQSTVHIRTGLDLFLRIAAIILAAAMLGGAWGFINSADRRSQFLPLVAVKHASIYAFSALLAAMIYFGPRSPSDPWPLSSAQTLMVAVCGAVLGVVVRFWKLRRQLMRRSIDLIVGIVNFTTRTSKAAAGAGRTLGGLVLIAFSAIPLSLIHSAFTGGQAADGAWLLALLAAAVGIALVYTGLYQASHGLLTLREAFAPNRFDLGNADPIYGQADNATLGRVKEAMSKASGPMRQKFDD
jgi:hypothetical protein